MAGTTSGYGFRYATSGDNLNAIGTATQNLAQDVENKLKGTFFSANSDVNGSTQNRSNLAYGDITDVQTQVTVGPSGDVLCILTADPQWTTSQAQSYASVRFSGALTQAASDSFAIVNSTNTDNQSSVMTVLTGCTPGGTLTATLNLRTSSTTSSNACRVTRARIQLVTLG